MARRMLASMEKSIGHDSPDAIEVSGLLVHIIMEQGKKRLPEAVSVAERALASAERVWGTRGKELNQPLRDLGDALGYFGSYVEARSVFQRQAENCHAVPELGDACAGTAYGALSNNGRLLGDYGAARVYMEKAIPLLETDRSPHGRSELAGALFTLSGFVLDNGDPEAALRTAERSVALLRTLPPPENGILCLAIAQLSGIHRELGDYEEARDMLTPCIQQQLAKGGPTEGSALTWLSSQARSISRLGDYETARRQAERALELFTGTVPKDDHTVGFFERNLALVHIDAGNDAAAEPLLEDCIRVRGKAFGEGHPAIAEYLDLLARTEYRLGKDAEALEHALRAESIRCDKFQEIASILSERQAYQFEASRASGLQVSFSVVGRASDSAHMDLAGLWDVVIRSRALVLDELTSRNRTASRVDPKIASLLLGLQNSRSRLAALVLHAANDKTVETAPLIAEAQTRKESIEQELTRLGVESGLRKDPKPIRFSDVRSALPAGSALLSFVEFERMSGMSTSESWYAALVMTAASPAPRFFLLGSGKEIESLVQRWREQAGRPPMGLERSGGAWEQRYREAGRLLRQRIWDPVAPAFRGSKTVFVVPDGALNLVSMATLPDDDGRYLVESDPLIHYLSTERDLLRQADAPRTAHGALILGAPDLDEQETGLAASSSIPTGRQPAFRSASPECAEARGLRFDPIPGTLQEIRDVGSLLGGGERVTELTGRAATEEAFKALAPGKRLLHIATHGFFVQERCQSVLSQQRLRGTNMAKSAAKVSAAGDNPLLLSGLTLAGANRPAGGAAAALEDGFLTAEEIGALDLKGVAWAVLSACETGVGKVVPGEGVLGLRRAFAVAGAGTLIMSLWRVEDDSTREWMQELYRGRRARHSTALCVTEASRAMIRERRARGATTHPFYWGGFVAEGDWR
jgi:CHAT domain-containing protein/tetratricopeptide (TPR) repeat protein